MKIFPIKGIWFVVPHLNIDGAGAGVSVNVWNAKCHFLERVIDGPEFS